MKTKIYLSLLISIFLFGCKENVEKMSAKMVNNAPLATIAEVQIMFESGDLTSEQLVQQCMDRITAFDKKGPALNAMIIINKEALDDARNLDKERKQKGSRGPLHGIPIILKDNFNTKDFPTTGGSAILKESQPKDDAFVVERLIEAGAIIIGKASMSEFALSYGWLGYSSVVGQTKNPHNTLRDPSGSSSGSAVAVVVGYALLGTGTDTAGSIRAPAAVCGIVGIKPTIGLMSRNGIIPASLTFDVPGPLARNVTDAAIMLEVMTGFDPLDITTNKVKGKKFNFQAALKKDALQKSRIGIIRTFSGANFSVDSIFSVAIETLKKEGSEVFEVELPEPLDHLWAIMGPVVDADFGSQIEEYLAGLPEGGPKTVEDLINIAESDAIINSATPLNPARIQGFKDALASGGYNSTNRNRNIEYLIPEVQEKLLNLLKNQNLDALVFPTITCPASVRHDAEDDTYVCNIDDTYRPCYLASTSGFPEISVPSGFTSDGMPVGLSFLGKPFSEEILIGLAYDFEQATLAGGLPKTTPILKAAAQ